MENLSYVVAVLGAFYVFFEIFNRFTSKTIIEITFQSTSEKIKDDFFIFILLIPIFVVLLSLLYPNETYMLLVAILVSLICILMLNQCTKKCGKTLKFKEKVKETDEINEYYIQKALGDRDAVIVWSEKTGYIIKDLPRDVKFERVSKRKIGKKRKIVFNIKSSYLFFILSMVILTSIIAFAKENWVKLFILVSLLLLTCAWYQLKKCKKVKY